MTWLLQNVLPCSNLLDHSKSRIDFIDNFFFFEQKLVSIFMCATVCILLICWKIENEQCKINQTHPNTYFNSFIFYFTNLQVFSRFCFTKILLFHIIQFQLFEQSNQLFQIFFCWFFQRIFVLRNTLCSLLTSSFSIVSFFFILLLLMGINLFIFALLTFCWFSWAIISYTFSYLVAQLFNRIFFLHFFLTSSSHNYIFFFY